MIAAESTLMFAEAADAAGVVSRQRAANSDTVAALAERLRADPPRVVATVARGSSDHAATFAKYLIETHLGLLVASAAPSVSSVYHAAPRFDDTLLLALSQSGRSPDLLAAVAAGRDAGALVVAMVNQSDTPLSALADAVLPIHAGAERSVAATKSYIATLAAILDLVAAWSGDAALSDALDTLPALLEQAWQCDWSPLSNALRDVRGLYVVGRGLGLGIAQEAALKFKETCGIHAEAFSAAELRHGPMALVGPDFPLLVLRQDDEAGDGIEALAAEMAMRGGAVFLAGGTAPGAITLPVPAAPAVIQPLLQVQAFYRAVNALSVARGFDPDRPPHLRKVTETL